MAYCFTTSKHACLIACVLLELTSLTLCSQTTECGEVVFLEPDQPTVGLTLRIQPPRNNDDHDKDTQDCLLYIRSPPGTTIRIDGIRESFVAFDGLGTNSSHRVEVGGDRGNFTSTGRVVTCQFSLNSREQHDVTIQATVQVYNVVIQGANPGECGGTIYLDQTKNTSTIRATNSYPSGGSANCYWYIYSPANTNIIFEFDELQLEINDWLYIYDSKGRYIMRTMGLRVAPQPVICDSYARLRFDAYYSVSDSWLSIKIIYTERLSHDADGVLLSSAGVIELNENVTSLTIKSTNLTSHDSSINMYNYWYVTGPVGSRIKAEFHDLTTGEYVDYTVYDSTSTSRPVSRFSNPSPLPEDRVFSGNAATIEMSFGWDYPGAGVLFTVSLTDDVPVVGPNTCGGTITLNNSHPNYIFNSPNYYDQHQYSGRTSCWWYATSPPGKEISLTWLHVDTTNEYVRLYDYPVSNAYPVSYLRGDIEEDLSQFVSTRGGITLFLDDYSSSVNGRGFLVDVSITDETFVVGPRSCGGTIKLSSSMPNFTLNYPYYYQASSTGYVDCYWYVTSPPGLQVQLTWLDIETYNGHILVYDYPTGTSYWVSRIQGTIDIDISPLVSSRGGFTLCFDDYATNMNGRGFLVEFTMRDSSYYYSSASCGGTIPLSYTSPNATFSTPYYYQPSTSVAEMDCWWYIISPPGEEVHLTVLDLETMNEYILIYDYPYSSSYTYQISRMSGSVETNVNVLSSRGGLTVFYDDYSSALNRKGFLFEARILDADMYSSPESCGGAVPLSYSSPNVTLATPHFFKNSSSIRYMDCWWRFTCPPGEEIHMTVVGMETVNEKLYIYDDLSTTYYSNYLVSFMYGRLESSASTLSSRGGLTVHHEDSSSEYNGRGVLFKAHILGSTPPFIPGMCGGTVPLSTSSPRVTMTTPLFFRPSTADVYIDCWWYITGQSGKQVEISVQDMETEYEYLSVYDYPSSLSSSTQLSRVRGNVSESTVVSTRGGFSLFFDDQSNGQNGRGFILNAALTDEFSWDNEVLGSCGQTVQFDHSFTSMVFSTPTYPREVLNDMFECYWYFTCQYGYRIELHFFDFDIYYNSHMRVSDYTYDYSTYRIAYISAQSLPGPAPIQSSSNRMTVYYYDGDWSESTMQRGVLANVSITPSSEPTWDKSEPMSSCGSAVTLTQQHDQVPLATPDYMNVNGDYFNCKWFVKSPAKSSIRINFDYFWLVGSSYIRVYDGQHTGYPQLLYATGSSLPTQVNSTKNAMTVYYYSNRQSSGNGASFVVSIFEDEFTTPSHGMDTTLQKTVPLTTRNPLASKARVICDSTSMTVLLDKDLLDINHAGDIHFADENCVGYSHDHKNVALYTRYDRCLTQFEETDDIIIYSNVVTYSSPKPLNNTDITRENILQIPVRCELDRHRLLGDYFIPKTGVISFTEEGYGNFSLSLDRYPDQTFNHPVVNKEAEVLLGEHLYFAVNLTSVSGLTVFIENCWATPTPYPNGGKAYNFLDNGCSKDPTLQVLSHIDTSFAPFLIDAFTFIDENPQVFIHCEVLVCDSDPSARCAQGCQSRVRRGGRHIRGTSSTPHLISNGPLSSRKAQGHVTENSDYDVRTLGMNTGLLIGILFGTVCLIVAIVSVALYMKSSRRSYLHGYQRVNDNDDKCDD